MLASQTSGFPITVSVAGTTPAAAPTVAASPGTPATPTVAAAAPAPGLAYTGSAATFDLALAAAVILLGAALARAAHVLPSFRAVLAGRR
jgi:hypothetical protein